MEIPLTNWHERIVETWSVSVEVPRFRSPVVGKVTQTDGGVVFWPSIQWSPGDKDSLGPCVSLKDAKAKVLEGLSVLPEFPKSATKWEKKKEMFWVFSCLEGFFRIKIWKEGDEYKGTISDREIRTYKRLDEAKSRLMGSLYMVAAISYDQVKAMLDPEYRKMINDFNDAQSGH